MLIHTILFTVAVMSSIFSYVYGYRYGYKSGRDSSEFWSKVIERNSNVATIVDKLNL
jgi:hypothetical protein